MESPIVKKYAIQKKRESISAARDQKRRGTRDGVMRHLRDALYYHQLERKT